MKTINGMVDIVGYIGSLSEHIIDADGLRQAIENSKEGNLGITQCIGDR